MAGTPSQLTPQMRPAIATIWKVVFHFPIQLTATSALFRSRPSTRGGRHGNLTADYGNGRYGDKPGIAAEDIAVAEALYDEDKSGGYGQLVRDRIEEGAEPRAEVVFARDEAVSQIGKAGEAEDQGCGEVNPVEAQFPPDKVPVICRNVEKDDENRDHQDSDHGQDIGDCPHGFLSGLLDFTPYILLSESRSDKTGLKNQALMRSFPGKQKGRSFDRPSA